MIQAEATTPIPTGVVFWSHDKGTAKLIIQLKKDHINQTLPQGTIVPILLEFNSDTAAKGKGRHIYHAVIENALEGIVSIVLEDNILGYVGRVDGSVYIELPDSRSLDTAGRFTFDIKRSPIDEDVPELEDYYWQGFNEIIQESKRLIDQVESNCETVLNDLSSKVTSLEIQTSDIKSKQAEILKSIEDNDVFTKQESSANVIYQVIGKEKVRMTFTLDFLGKEAGVMTNNANTYKAYGGTSLGVPSNFTSEIDQNSYNKIAKLDNNLSSYPTTGAGYIRQVLLSYNVLDFLKKQLGEEYFTAQGALSNSEQVELIKPKITNDQGNVYGYGVGAGGNKLTFAVWNVRWLNWSGTKSRTTATVSNISIPINNAKEYIDSDGNCHFIAYAPVSDDSTASAANLDYANYQFTIELSMNEFIQSMIAANHIENLAAQEEAEASEDNTKTMTPLRVFQSIAKWTKDKFVSMTENETVLGIKNFANGLQVNGRNVLSQKGEIVFDHTSETDSSIQSGIVRFKRYGDWILVNFNFQCRSTDIASGGNLIDSLEADIVPSGSIQVDVTFDKALTIDASGKVTALWGLEANKYYTGSATYFAKNKL
ncbi:BppU family phage baseplate upper protein [Enterococcus malodoratus]|uniref:BppU family phage baseplate upper protein n=2 Tax=Enterococcus malodoratus TaxID=71451 RepID=UPI000DD06033|nr:BppU family phage baseplate upper protein [Enterococcus malodoratus]